MSLTAHCELHGEQPIVFVCIHIDGPEDIAQVRVCPRDGHMLLLCAMGRAEHKPEWIQSWCMACAAFERLLPEQKEVC